MLAAANAKGKGKGKGFDSDGLRQTFERMPEGICKRFVRASAEHLDEDGRIIGLAAALEQSLELFPETWVTMRGMQNRPWVQNDINLALRTAEVAAQLREEFFNLLDAGSQSPPKGTGKGFTAFSGNGHMLGE